MTVNEIELNFAMIVELMVSNHKRVGEFFRIKYSDMILNN